jgi:uncharacterized protein YpmB
MSDETVIILIVVLIAAYYMYTQTQTQTQTKKDDTVKNTKREYDYITNVTFIKPSSDD